MTVLVRLGAVESRRFGFELVKPSSVVVTGGSSSATISSLGSVEFSSCASLSLNGVFSSGYDNYMVVAGNLTSTHTASQGFTTRLRSSGSDNTSSSTYVYQALFANSSTLTALRGTENFWFLGSIASSTGQRSGSVFYFYGPNLAQPTAARAVSMNGQSGAEITDYAATHSLSTAYDGFTLSLVSGSFSGRVAVYGMRG